MPKGANRAAGAGFFSVMIKYVVPWVAALAEEISCIVVFSKHYSTVSVMHSDLVLEILIL